jgi:predicted negative regulator of RcsB-dependent stress response
MQSDDEQVEELKRWWKKYGSPIVGGLAIGLIAVFGSRAWFDYQERQRISASAEYEQLQLELSSNNLEAARQRGAYLMDSYARTPYASLAGLALAKAHVERDDLAAARERLQWVLDNARDPELVHLARLRLARVLAAEGQPAQALALLEGVAAGAYGASYEELRGDLYVDSGDVERARAAYLKALESLGFGAGSELVQMKLDDLGRRS